MGGFCEGHTDRGRLPAFHGKDRKPGEGSPIAASLVLGLQTTRSLSRPPLLEWESSLKGLAVAESGRYGGGNRENLCPSKERDTTGLAGLGLKPNHRKEKAGR